MTIVTKSNHFNTITYAKFFCMPSLVAHKPCLNLFMRESDKNAKKSK